MRTLSILLLITWCFSLVKGRATTTAISKEHKDLKSNYMQDDSMENEMTEEEVGDYSSMADDDEEVTKAEENIGKHYFEGDVLTTRAQMAKLDRVMDLKGRGGSELQTRALIKDIRRTWKKGIVPYTVKKNVDKKRQRIIRDAIRHWEKKTCLKFKRREKEKDYVEFKQASGCSSFVGRIGGKQHIIVGNKRHSCRVGNIIHEIGHAIGFFHEQSRPDRDDFVKIKWKNIRKGYEINFKKFSTQVIDSKDVAYDYGSVMHYPRKIFGKQPKKPTVIPQKKTKLVIGQRKGLSEPDILQVGKLYGCHSKSDTDSDGMNENNTEDIVEDEMNNSMPSYR